MSQQVKAAEAEVPGASASSAGERASSSSAGGTSTVTCAPTWASQ